jgi:hypothetical protein
LRRCHVAFGLEGPHVVIVFLGRNGVTSEGATSTGLAEQRIGGADTGGRRGQGDDNNGERREEGGGGGERESVYVCW